MGKRTRGSPGRSWRWWALFLLYMGLGLLGLVGPSAAQESGGRAEVLRVEGAITPIVATYIERGIASAEAEGADLLI
ncbi:MAG: NfeD family protein, partial [Anaerolineae bacterium]